jgi:GT2 family glycosyltransferase
MLFSVVILSFNSQRTIDKCLLSIRDSLSSFDEPSEIFVIENGSSDNSSSIISTHCKQSPDMVKMVSFEENTGTTFSRNAGLKMSSGKYVLILDSDAYMTKDALICLKQHLDSNPSVGLLSPQLAYGDGRFQLSTDTFPTVMRKIKRFLYLDEMQGAINTSVLTSKKVDYAISACWLIKREAVNACDGFDEAIFYSPEDVDYCVQIWLSGYEIHYVPTSIVVHDAQELSRGFKITKFHLSHLGGLFYLFKKYKYFLTTSSLYKKINIKHGKEVL